MAWNHPGDPFAVKIAEAQDQDVDESWDEFMPNRESDELWRLECEQREPPSPAATAQTSPTSPPLPLAISASSEATDESAHRAAPDVLAALQGPAVGPLTPSRAGTPGDGGLHADTRSAKTQSGTRLCAVAFRARITLCGNSGL